MTGSSFSLFFSPLDKHVFEYISSNPGSYVMDVANNFDVSLSSTFFSLKRLHESGIIQKMEFKGKVIYYPKGLRSIDVELAFSQLKNERRKEIFLYVLDNMGCRQKTITDEFFDMSTRQTIRHLKSLVDADLLRMEKDEYSVTYTLGRIGREVVIGSFDEIDPFLRTLRDKTGELIVNMKKDGKMIITMLNGDSISIELGKWKIMNIDEDTIYKNKNAILGDGGEKTLIAIYNGCNSISSIMSVTGLNEKVITAKVGALSIMGLIANFDFDPRSWKLTHSGKIVAEKMLKMD